MEKTDFSFNRKPAFASFLVTYLVCFGIAFLLIRYSPAVSSKIIDHIIAPLGIAGLGFLSRLPYGILLSLPFIIYGLRLILWNLMSRYEITESEIRFLGGSLVRTERFFPVSGFCEVSFKQNLLEAPFGIGQMILGGDDGDKLIMKGVYGVKSVVEALRAAMESLHQERQNLPFSQVRTARRSAPSSKKGALGWVTAMLCILGLPLFLVVLSKIEVLTELLESLRQLFSA